MTLVYGMAGAVRNVVARATPRATAGDPWHAVPMMGLLLVSLLAPPPPTTIGLGLTVAATEGAPVVDRAWIDARVERANAIFAPAGLRFAVAWVRPAPPTVPARLITRADRHATGATLQPDVVNVYVAAHLEDIHEPGRVRRGVHWRPRRPKGSHLVIVAAYSGEHVLAHELGHFFGNPKHSDTPGNLMSYTRADGLPTLDAAQRRRIRAHLRRFLRTGELKRVDPKALKAPAAP